MHKFFNSVSLCLVALLLVAPVVQAGSVHANRHKSSSKFSSAHMKAHSKPMSKELEAQASCLYDEIELDALGLNKKAFEYAYKGYTYLVEHHRLNRTNILSICDFSQSSRNKRLYIVDLDQKKVLINTYVAHGRKSGTEFAYSFSNSQSSHKSSLGFYVTNQTYIGDHGLSLKIQGLEKGFNDRASSRNIVVHGSNYVGPDFLTWNQFNGRSFGCPAVPAAECNEVIETIKDGTCLFIYHPTTKYLVRSKILNY